MGKIKKKLGIKCQIFSSPCGAFLFTGWHDNKKHDSTCLNTDFGVVKDKGVRIKNMVLIHDRGYISKKRKIKFS